MTDSTGTTRERGMGIEWRDGVVPRTAKETYRCVCADQRTGKGYRERREYTDREFEPRAEDCASDIKPGERYIEDVESGSRYCWPCGVKNWRNA